MELGFWLNLFFWAFWIVKRNAAFKDGVFNTFMPVLPYSHLIFQELKTDTLLSDTGGENTYLYKYVIFLFIFLAWKWKQLDSSAEKSKKALVSPWKDTYAKDAVWIT